MSTGPTKTDDERTGRVLSITCSGRICLLIFDLLNNQYCTRAHLSAIILNIGIGYVLIKILPGERGKGRRENDSVDVLWHSCEHSTTGK